MESVETANDRFKQSFGNWFWGSLIAATVLHFLMFALWPNMTAADISSLNNQMEAIQPPPDVEIPPPPEQIARPATPVIAEAQVDEDITIAPTTFEQNPIDNLPPPPDDASGNIADQPQYTPYTLEPRITNEAEVQRQLELNYPPILRDSEIGGTVLVHFFIDENGRVGDYRIAQTSGYDAFDQAALAVADVMRFTPGENYGEKVPVWIAMPIEFRIR